MRVPNPMTDIPTTPSEQNHVSALGSQKLLSLLMFQKYVYCSHEIDAEMTGGRFVT